MKVSSYKLKLQVNISCYKLKFVWLESHITKQSYLTTRHGGQISQFKSSRNFWPIFVILWTTHFAFFFDCHHLHSSTSFPLFTPLSKLYVSWCVNHLHLFSTKTLRKRNCSNYGFHEDAPAYTYRHLCHVPSSWTLIIGYKPFCANRTF